MKNHAQRQYIQLCLFPDRQWQPRRSPRVTKAWAAVDERMSLVERHQGVVPGWRVHEYQLRLFSAGE